MRKIILTVAFILSLAALFYYFPPSATPKNVAEEPEFSVDKIGPNTKIASPFVVTGKARGWYFEGSFPVFLYDDKGNVLAQTQAVAQGDWMTSDPVAFRAEMNFDSLDAENGKIVFSKDNPSGLPENDKSFEMPVVFETAESGY